jgi:hypothetical protein
MKNTIITHFASMVIAGSAFAVDRLVPAQYPTIQAAIDAASNGDVVQIAPGTYPGPIDLKGKLVTVRGSVNDASAVVVNGGSPVLKCVTGESQSTVIEFITVTGGVNSDGDAGGILCNGTSPTIRNCRIVGNVARRGAGIFCEGGSPSLDANFIAGNSGGSADIRFAAGAGICIINSSASVTNCWLTGNQLNVPANGLPGQTPSPGSVSGAGLHAEGALAVKIRNTLIQSNQQSINAGVCANTGSAVFIGCPGEITECILKENIAAGCSATFGGVYFASNLVSMRGTRVCSNSGSQVFGAYINLGGNSISSACPTCAGDLNGDNQVNGADLGLLLTNWGPCPN